MLMYVYVFGYYICYIIGGDGLLFYSMVILFFFFKYKILLVIICIYLDGERLWELRVKLWELNIM